MSMETLIHADIFFVITSVAVVVLLILSSVALIYFIKILRDISHISDAVRKGVDNASNHMEELVSRLMENRIFKFMFSKKKARKHKEE